MALQVHGSTAYFPPKVFHSLPRPTAYTEIGEDRNGARKHPQMQQLHGACVLGEVPRLKRHSQVDLSQMGDRLHEKNKGHVIKSTEEATRGTRLDGFVFAGTVCFPVIVTGCSVWLSFKH